MSVITGMWNFANEPLHTKVLDSIADQAIQYGPEPRSNLYFDSIGFVYQSFDSGYEQSPGRCPQSSSARTTLMWNGRLDNREDIAKRIALSNSHRCASVRNSMSSQESAIDLVHAFYDKEGSGCFDQIIGDWCLSVWDGPNKRLTLACDFSGLRPLYYCRLPNAFIWCSDLKALVAGSGRTFELRQQYMAEYLGGMPPTGTTPYSEIHAVPAGHWLEVCERSLKLHSYWHWDIGNPIVYKSDVEYEEHFVHLFRQSVSRRVRSSFPIVAELSGGLDSSSIVCIADDIARRDSGVTPDIHTLSYFHGEEPSCDERPYFSVIEKARGRVGDHIDTANYDSLMLDLPFFVPAPVYPQGLIPSERDRWNLMRDKSAKVLLSGIGGDEFLGGVPTGLPELADLLYMRDLPGFSSSLGSWSMALGIPRWQLLGASAREALPRQVRDGSQYSDTKYSLLSRELANCTRDARKSIRVEWLSLTAKPSQRMFVEVWCNMLRQIASHQPPLFGCFETAYPYLDRDLLSFLINIPRGQLIRPGARRSLMRRALAAYVPSEVLWRKSKATAIRRFIRAFVSNSSELSERLLGSDSPLSGLHYVEREKVRRALAAVCNGTAEFGQPLMRVVGLDCWLRVAGGRLSTTISFVDQFPTERQSNFLARKTAATPNSQSINSN